VQGEDIWHVIELCGVYIAYVSCIAYIAPPSYRLVPEGYILVHYIF
jgi:hypothetical protein